jgi:hypothetical protein
MNIVLQILRQWLPLAVALTLLCGIIYATVQQTYRSNANDPQIQMAQDAVYALSNGSSPESLVSNTSVEIARGLSPYLIIYDERGNAIASDGVLDGKIPEMPNGVLNYSKDHGSDAITWQPRRGVRSALVIQPFNGAINGFVVAGRSLRVVEERESNLVMMIGLGWILSLGGLLILVVFLQIFFK